MTTQTASVLTIGTELTQGQITNKNAAWISAALFSAGIETRAHLTVADTHTDILDGLKFLSAQSRAVIVTGGLGPTSDDFTRNVVAEFINAPLEYDPASWDRIHERLTRFNLKIAESNRAQCYFPKGSVILNNSAGTASGFQIQTIFVFPGPPRELETVWNENGVTEKIRALLGPLPRFEIHRFHCMGKPEAELGEIVEPLIQGLTIDAAYRAHFPIIEIKLRTKTPIAPAENTAIQAARSALQPWVVSEGEDEPVLGKTAFDHLKKNHPIPFRLEDRVTGGMLQEQIGKHFQNGTEIQWGHSTTSPLNTLTVEWLSEGQVQASLIRSNSEEPLLSFRVQLPFQAPPTHERVRRTVMAQVLRQLDLRISGIQVS